MKIAIVIHTNTGRTLRVAQATRDLLEAKGHEVDLTGLRTTGTASPGFLPGANNFSIKNPPDLSDCDAVIVGGPIWAFKASPVIMRYLVEDVTKLKGKFALSFVTLWNFGAKRALAKMDEELATAGGDILESEAIAGMFDFDKKIDGAAKSICDKICAAFESSLKKDN